MALFFRVIELDDGRWACRHGSLEYDIHALMNQAIEHITALAANQRPAELFLHRLDGSVRSLGTV
jgi:hypothetical protein